MKKVLCPQGLLSNAQLLGFSRSLLLLFARSALFKV